MAEDGNYIELRFTNAMMLDIFSRYASDSELAGFVAEDGSIFMRFEMINGLFR